MHTLKRIPIFRTGKKTHNLACNSLIPNWDGKSKFLIYYVSPFTTKPDPTLRISLSVHAQSIVCMKCIQTNSARVLTLTSAPIETK